MQRILIMSVVLVIISIGFEKAYADDKYNITLMTQDNHAIALNHFERGFEEIIILAHGYRNNKDVFLFQKMAERFAREFDVISFDFRGHGKSDGRFTWTAQEDKDLRAIVTYAQDFGYEKIGVIGFSLGAAITLIEGSTNPAIDSIIAVSAPSHFWKINYRFWRKEMFNDLTFNLSSKGRGKGVRPGNPFRDKTPPIAIVRDISPTPILFIHGGQDWLIKPIHSARLYERAKEPKQLYIMYDAGHAEKIFDNYPQEFEKVCVTWFRNTLLYGYKKEYALY